MRPLKKHSIWGCCRFRITFFTLSKKQIMNRLTLVILLFFYSVLSLSQSIKGTVYDVNYKNPIYGASVYFDGSTIGVITDESGRFEIETPLISHATLIISFIGYRTIKLENQFEEKELKIAMVEEAFQIPEFVGISDPFSRRQKLSVFKKEFLGDSRAGNSCEIINEDLIELYFNTYDNTLTAFATEPLIIKNTYLGYEVSFEIKEFKIYFKKNNLDRLDNIIRTAIVGQAFFKEISDTPFEYMERRDKTYFGSVMHFMRTIWSGEWKEQRLKLRYLNNRRMPPKDLIQENTANDTNPNFKTITFKRLGFNIYFKKKYFNYRSKVSIDTTSYSVLLDKFGKYKPYNTIEFGGHMAEERIGNLLPINFQPYKSISTYY